MVPAAFMSLDALPINENGKLDRRRLPAPGAGPVLQTIRSCRRRRPNGRSPGSGKRSLELSFVSIHDSFFDLGGHSMLAVKIAMRSRETFGIDLPVAALFHAPTVATLAAAIDAIRDHGAPAGGVDRPRGDRTVTTREFLLELRHLDVDLWLEGDRVRCSAPPDVLTAERRAELARRKARDRGAAQGGACGCAGEHRAHRNRRLAIAVLRRPGTQRRRVLFCPAGAVSGNRPCVLRAAAAGPRRHVSVCDDRRACRPLRARVARTPARRALPARRLLPRRSHRIRNGPPASTDEPRGPRAGLVRDDVAAGASAGEPRQARARPVVRRSDPRRAGVCGPFGPRSRSQGEREGPRVSCPRRTGTRRSGAGR